VGPLAQKLTSPWARTKCLVTQQAVKFTFAVFYKGIYCFSLSADLDAGL
jgi:hypothetical protein